MVDNKSALDQLQQDVENESSAVDAAVTLISGLVNRLSALLTLQPVSSEDLTTQIQSLRDEVAARSTALAQAVAEGTAAENDSSNFPTQSDGSASSTPTTSDPSTETTSSDTSGTSDSGNGASAGTVTPAPDTSAESGNPVAPSTDATADVDVAPPSAGDISQPLSDSPPAVETEGDEAVANDEPSE